MTTLSGATRLLREARDLRHLTQEGLAQELTDLAGQLHRAGELGRRTSVSPRQVRRWEASCPPWPHPDHRRLLERFFGVPVTTLGFEQRSQVARADQRPQDDDHASAVALVSSVDTGLHAVDGALPWLVISDTTRGGRAERSRVGECEIAQLRSALGDLDYIDQRYGSGLLWRSAQIHLSWVHHLIDVGRYDAVIGESLRSIAGHLTASLGWFCYDAEKQPAARMLFSEALNNATLARDLPLATRTLGNMARQAVDLNKGRDAIRYASIGQSQADEWNAPPRVHALLSMREAQGHARVGDEPSFAAAIRRSWQQFDAGPYPRDPEWTRFLTESEMDGLEGMGHLDLGWYRKAVTALEAATTTSDVKWTRNRGMLLTKLSDAALRAGDLDRSVHSAGQVLALIDGGLNSARSTRQLRAVGDDLGRSGAGGAVKDMAERLRLYVA